MSAAATTTPSDSPAIVLLSGGLDSATCLAIARAQGFAPHCVSFDYGQRHRFELDAAAQLATALGAASHRTVTIDPQAFAGSALTTGPAVPKHAPNDEVAPTIPGTYVPARNLVLLAYATGRAEVLGAADVFIGVNAVDYSGYPDCRPEFLAAFEQMAALGMKAGVEGAAVKLHAPLVEMTKAQIIQRGTELEVDYASTSSCYQPDTEGRPCLRCDSCVLRERGFAEAGLEDPLLARFR